VNVRSAWLAPERWFVYGVTAFLLLVIVLPIVVIVLGACLNTPFLGAASEQWIQSTDQLFTGRWFAYVLELYGDSMLFSVKLALLSVLACLLIGVPGGYALVRYRFPGSRVLEELALLPLSLPGIVMSVALIQSYGVIRGKWWFILLGHLLYTIPFMVRAVTTSLRSFDVERLEAAARSLGANFLQRFFFIVLPGLKQALIVGSLLVFAVSWGEFNVSFLLNTPLNQTYPAALYATYTANSFQVSSAATTIFLAVVLPLLVAIQWVGGKDPVKVEQGA
jgi:putative spermidine/putrescine transport system permease protein